MSITVVESPSIVSSKVGSFDDSISSELGTIVTKKRMALTTANIALNNVLILEKIPVTCIPDVVKIYNDALDSNGSPALAFSAGLYFRNVDGSYSVANTGDDTAFAAAGQTTLQTANTAGVDLVDVAGNFKHAATMGNRIVDFNSDTTHRFFYVGLKITTAAGTAAAGNLGWDIRYQVGS